MYKWHSLNNYNNYNNDSKSLSTYWSGRNGNKDNYHDHLQQPNIPFQKTEKQLKLFEMTPLKWPMVNK